jgi:hypothetical protein
MRDPWVSGVPTVGGTATGSRSVVEVLTSVETLEKADYVTAREGVRIRKRIEKARYLVHFDDGGSGMRYRASRSRSARS